MIASTKSAQVSYHLKIYRPNGRGPKAGEICKNPDLARTLRKLVEAEKGKSGKRVGTRH